MTATERYVWDRFDALEARFRIDLDPEDFRLRPILRRFAGKRGGILLDLGCGKGRFASALKRCGFEVVGIDVSSGMLASARGLDRLRATARRLPFASGSFDGVVAVEVFEHLDPIGQRAAIEEAARVLRPGGLLAIVDKNVYALDANRPWLPSLAVKWVDERRGRWMYPIDAPFRERWFRPGGLKSSLRRRFGEVEVEFLLSPGESRNAIHRCLPGSRLHALWTASSRTGGRSG